MFVIVLIIEQINEEKKSNIFSFDQGKLLKNSICIDAVSLLYCTQPNSGFNLWDRGWGSIDTRLAKIRGCRPKKSADFHKA